MTRRQWLVSAFLVWHLAAVLSAVVPSPSVVGSPPRDVSPATDNWLVARTASSLDVGARVMHGVMAGAWRVVAPVRTLTSGYLNVLGFDEYWTMFASPVKGDQYLRVRYFVAASAAEGSRTATELVFPAWPEYEVRTVGAFRGSYQDRAMNTMLEHFHEARAQQSQRSRPASPPAASAYIPLATYFSHRYQRDRMSRDQHLVRVEIWHGVAPNPLPGSLSVPSPERMNLLRDYHSGLIDALGSASPAAPGATEREADIVWTLEFTEAR